MLQGAANGLLILIMTKQYATYIILVYKDAISTQRINWSICNLHLHFPQDALSMFTSLFLTPEIHTTMDSDIMEQVILIKLELTSLLQPESITCLRLNHSWQRKLMWVEPGLLFPKEVFILLKLIGLQVWQAGLIFSTWHFMWIDQISLGFSLLFHKEIR